MYIQKDMRSSGIGTVLYDALEDIAKIVIMPGDPLRAKYIAENFLENVTLVNSVRGMFAYTGEYKGKRITVMAHGMGNGSIGIYSYELYKFYDVDVIIRMGTCGTSDPDMNILDIVLLETSYTESNFALLMNRDNNTHTAYANIDLNEKILKTAEELNLPVKFGDGVCGEFFDVYFDEEKFQDMVNHFPPKSEGYNFLAIEMEAFALFYVSNILNKKAACLLTLVDSRYKPTNVVTSEEREQKLENMIKIALETSLKL